MNGPRVLLCGFFAIESCLSAVPDIRVSGDLLEINGASEIPRGLFGVHAANLTPEDILEYGIESVRLIHQNPAPSPTRIGADKRAPRGLATVVDCWFDRYQPALQLTDPEGWRDRLEALGRGFAGAAKAGEPANLEFWNEPYLNWATKPGVNYAPAPFITENVKSGDPMILRKTGKPVEGLVWDREIFFVRNKDGSLNYVLSGYIPRDAEPGEEVQLGYGAGKAVLEDGGTVFLRGAEHPVARLWSGRDPGQEFYWSGPVNVRLYNEMLSVLGPAVKETNPAVQLAAGWGFNFFNENWESWRRLIKPTIDAVHPWIDALHEHHYGGDTRRVAASYEVAYAYALGNHGRRLGFWNTEAGGYLDPQQPGNPKVNAPPSPAARVRNSATYLLRDIAYLLDRMPEKALHRAAHEPENNGGDLPALQLLKPVRGRLLAVENNIPGIFARAAIEGRRMSILLFNDSRAEIRAPLDVTAPGGTAFKDAIEQRLEFSGEAPHARVVTEPLDARGNRWKKTVALPQQSAAVLVFHLDRDPGQVQVVRRVQFSSPDVLLQPVEGAWAVDVELPPGPLREFGGKEAILRLVLGNTSARFSIEINGRRAAPANGPDSPVWDIRFPASWLRPGKNAVRLSADPSKDLLLATGIYLETREPSR